MTPEVKELYDALCKPTTIYRNGKGEYEHLRARLIRDFGYKTFRARQHQALLELALEQEGC